jgi:hypothetical protein
MSVLRGLAIGSGHADAAPAARCLPVWIERCRW